MTVLVVLDGFRHDYLRDESTFSPAAMTALSESGAALTEVVPVFPSSRLPNLASLATGVYAENHGVLDDEEVTAGDGEDQAMARVLRSNETEFWQTVKQLGTIWVKRRKNNCWTGRLSMIFYTKSLLYAFFFFRICTTELPARNA